MLTAKLMNNLHRTYCQLTPLVATKALLSIPHGMITNVILDARAPEPITLLIDAICCLTPAVLPLHGRVLPIHPK